MSSDKKNKNDMALTWGRVAMQPFFPFSNVLVALLNPPSKSPARVVPDSPGYISPFDVKGNMMVILGLVKSVVIATFIMSSPFLWPVEQASTLGSWVVVVLIRDVALSLFVCCTWDWFLYFSPYAERLRGLKFNLNIPPMSQFMHDAFNTTIATCCAALIECYLMHAIATGRYQYVDVTWPSLTGLLKGEEDDLSLLLSPNALMIIFTVTLTTHWRLPHFYLIHRGSHPWGWELPVINIDVGKLVYHKVHKLHHRSRNPTAFSGISMHPVEATLYFSAALIPLLFGLHPITFLVCKFDLWLGAQYGHDGFQYPGHASYIHWLHHHYFECNYSENIVFSLDHVFGSFYDGSIPWSEFAAKRKMCKLQQDIVNSTDAFRRFDDKHVEGRSAMNRGHSNTKE